MREVRFEATPLPDRSLQRNMGAHAGYWARTLIDRPHRRCDLAAAAFCDLSAPIAGDTSMTRCRPAAVAGMIALMVPAASAETVSSHALARLVAAYPAYLERIEGNMLVWKDGTRMVLDEGHQRRDHDAMLAAADIKDVVATPYPWGRSGIPPGYKVDPGRARNAAFFDKMYGRCMKGEVAKNLVDVPWLPKKGGGRVKATVINGVAEKLAAVSRDLDDLPASFNAFLLPAAGAYACRPIAGTSRVSAHGHGIAIDIAAATTDYWLWNKSGDSTGSSMSGGVIPYKNRVPFEIVEIFERHGFIWGGKWYHYDTMHFEYRPELVAQPP
jgi:hypothetical protein